MIWEANAACSACRAMVSKEARGLPLRTKESFCADTEAKTRGVELGGVWMMSGGCADMSLPCARTSISSLARSAQASRHRQSRDREMMMRCAMVCVLGTGESLYGDTLIDLKVRGYFVSDEDNGDVAFEVVDGCGEVCGCFVIKSAEGFVEEKDLGFTKESPSDSEALALSAGEAYATFTQGGVVSLGECLDGGVDVGELACLDDHAEGGTWSGEEEVFEDCAGEQDGFLGDDAEVASKLWDWEGRDIAGIEGNAAGGGDQMALHHFHEC